jgi:hypothetical protein
MLTTSTCWGWTITNGSLRAAILHEFGVAMCWMTMSNYLRRLGLSWNMVRARKRTFYQYRSDAIRSYIIQLSAFRKREWEEKDIVMATWTNPTSTKPIAIPCHTSRQPPKSIVVQAGVVVLLFYMLSTRMDHFVRLTKPAFRLMTYNGVETHPIQSLGPTAN